MTARELIDRRRVPLRLVIFDCDGVLVDSEPVTNRVVAAALADAGWRMDAAEAERRFLGMSLDDIQPMAEAALGRTLPAGWEAALTDRLVAALAREVTPIPGAVAALEATAALGLAWRVASNSSHAEMRAKFAAVGITLLVAGRLHSFHDVPRGKPAPDLFLAAAAAEGAVPAECIVIEDSPTGARGAAAAGMDCLGYAPAGDGAALCAAGAAPFASMFDLPGLLAAAPRRIAA
jgi:HAD superfamily hydrolase (TIGR01509 family)